MQAGSETFTLEPGMLARVATGSEAQDRAGPERGHDHRARRDAGEGVRAEVVD